MKAEIKPSRAHGVFNATPSKSAAHRALICAALTEGETEIKNVEYSQDILATLDCLESLGIAAERYDKSVVIHGGLKELEKATLNCRESGSTLRFLIPVSLLTGGKITFTGSQTLMSRPLGVYEDIFSENDIDFRREDGKITLNGSLKPTDFKIPGNISSQFITGLLFALPVLSGDSRIEIIPPYESKPYVDMTAKYLEMSGVKLNFKSESEILITGNQKYKCPDMTVEGDWSNAAFFEFLNYLGSDVTVTGLDEESLQGDKICLKYFETLKTEKPEIDITDYPDLGPVLFAAAFRNGAVFTGTRRLKIKESDRCASMAAELAKFGIKTAQKENSFTVYKSELKAPAVPLDGHNDHRIVMALSILSTLTGAVIEDAQAVEKSMPAFFGILKTLGIEVNVIETA